MKAQPPPDSSARHGATARARSSDRTRSSDRARSSARTGSPPPIRLRRQALAFGGRTYVMGILNLTPDSFSGDGLLRAEGTVEELAVEQAKRMVKEGADILDLGGESTRPGHAPVSLEEELDRVTSAVLAVRAALPEVPISIDTRKPEVAEAALAAGADLVNDVTAVTNDAALAEVAARHAVPYILMHGRDRPEYRDVVTEVMADLAAALERAREAGCAPDSLIVDPGIGFGKTPSQNLVLLRELAVLGRLGRPVLLGTSRKSTIGAVLDLPAEERLEGTLATTALGIASGVDIVRVHDVSANVRVARMCDAIIRGTWSGSHGPATDRLLPNVPPDARP